MKVVVGKCKRCNKEIIDFKHHKKRIYCSNTCYRKDIGKYERDKTYRENMSLIQQGKNKGKNLGNQFYKLRDKNNNNLINSQFKKGHNTWNKGYGDYIKGEKNPRYGKVGSDLSKKMWANPEWREKTIKTVLKGLMKRPTSLEKQFIGIIERNNLPYKYTGNGEVILGGKNPDFVNINGQKICIEVANRFHHQPPWEEKRLEHFARYGWKCLIFFADGKNGKHMKFDDSEEEMLRKIKGG